jgi:hypothetical protein
MSATMLLLSLFGWWYFLKFNEVRPYDWLLFIVEVAVLFVIAHETFWRPSRVRRWRKKIYKCFSEGQIVQDRVPPQGPDQVAVERAEAWNADVDQWFIGTHELLKKYSLQSAGAFIHDPMRPAMEYRLHELCRHRYHTLADRLQNLRDIMEKPDIYF